MAKCELNSAGNTVQLSRKWLQSCDTFEVSVTRQDELNSMEADVPPELSIHGLSKPRGQSPVGRKVEQFCFPSIATNRPEMDYKDENGMGEMQIFEDWMVWVNYDVSESELYDYDHQTPGKRNYEVYSVGSRYAQRVEEEAQLRRERLRRRMLNKKHEPKKKICYEHETIPRCSDRKQVKSKIAATLNKKLGTDEAVNRKFREYDNLPYSPGYMNSGKNPILFLQSDMRKRKKSTDEYETYKPPQAPTRPRARSYRILSATKFLPEPPTCERRIEPVTARDFIKFLTTLSNNTITSVTDKRKQIALYRRFLERPELLNAAKHRNFLDRRNLPDTCRDKPFQPPVDPRFAIYVKKRYK